MLATIWGVQISNRVFSLLFADDNCRKEVGETISTTRSEDALIPVLRVDTNHSTGKQYPLGIQWKYDVN